jgi:ABC-2 type transport system ATP-binding protein
MEEADELCDRLAIIDHGKIVALDTPKSLKKSLGGDVVRMKMAERPNLTAVRRLRYVKGAKYENGFLTLTVSDAGTHLQEILKKVGRVESVESRSPTLNDVFLHFAGREMRDEEGNESFFEKAIQSNSNNR